jgi:hypothetical protein
MGIWDSVNSSSTKEDSELKNLERERNKTVLQEDIQYRTTSIEERRAVEAELKRRHGPDWRRVLGLVGKIDMPTLRSFLGTANQGMRRAARDFSPRRTIK